MREEIVAFVRGTLGCQCPDRVFDELEVDGRLRALLGAEAALVDRVIRCADRLLVLESSRPDQAARLLEAGRALRDRLGLHRVRVAVHGSPQPVEPPRDDRVHLHWI